MLQDVLRSIERRCRTEAPSLLDEVRAALALSSPPTLASTLPDGSVWLAGGGDPAPPIEPVAPVPTASDAGRYDDLGPIGAGGMGEVRRVRDRELNRVVAMKLLHADVAAGHNAIARFVEEVQTTAQLQHPGIVPVYDAGRLGDGRVYFTMKEVRGRTLSEVIQEVHAASVDRWRAAPSGWTFRRLVSALLQVSQAVAYAHDRGVVHRDLKPANVMVGAFGEVQVMDWGLCKVVGRADSALDAVVIERTREATRAGRVLGTPAYMAPEQAMGDVDAIDARSDVYALGAMLYEVLTGRRPYVGATAQQVIQRVLDGPPERPSRSASRGVSDSETVSFDGDWERGPEPVEGEAAVVPSGDLPEEVVEICLRAMARDPRDRPASAGAFASELEEWLDGSKRREQALTLVGEAAAALPEAEELRRRAAALRAEASAELAARPAHAPEEEKMSAWAKQDEAAELERRASLASLRHDQLLESSLSWSPDLPEALAALAEDQRARHGEAEARRDRDAAGRAEALLRSHVDRLPERDPTRARCAAYLRGTGALTLVTEPAGAEVELLRFEPLGRRLVARPARRLGVTPLVDVAMEMGSYLCHLRLPGRAPVAYPVHIGREARWDGVRPGSREPFAVPLPPADALGPDDCYVAAGWFQVGSKTDYAAPPPARWWCDGFVVKRFPVTQREYLGFLDDLVARGREEEAMRYACRERAASLDERGALVLDRSADGRFALRAGQDPDWPVTMVDWYGASAYARWLAERTGQPWRLPWDFEWEKAARGVDGRAMPWGDGFDVTYCRVKDSDPGAPTVSVVDSYPIDASVYGVRGLGGNVMDWCQDVWTKAGPPGAGPVVAPYEDEGPHPQTHRRVNRGGYWFGGPGLALSAGRGDYEPRFRDGSLGFRVARPWGPEEGALPPTHPRLP